MNRALWTSFPLADLPGGEALLPDSVPLGARVCLLYGHNPQVVRAPITSSWRPHEEFLCNLALHLHLRGRIVAPEDLKPGDYILLCHHPCEGPMPRFRDGGAPLFSGPEHLSLSDAWTGFRMRAQLRRCQQSLPERISRSRHQPAGGLGQDHRSQGGSVSAGRPLAGRQLHLSGEFLGTDIRQH